ncbi:MAG: MucR family transcriptional regulator [Roseiarcus sp.]
MTPEQYRAKRKSPADYPMVAANYAAQRSALAKKIGLGRLRKGGGGAKSSPVGRARRRPDRRRQGASSAAEGENGRS